MEMTIDFVKHLKNRILQSRYVTAKMANAESLRLYFLIGQDIEEQFERERWGAKVLESLSLQLQQELPGLRGFSAKNIDKMRTFYNAWKLSREICSSLTSKLDAQTGMISSLLTSKIGYSQEGQHFQNSNAELEYFFSISFTNHYEIILKTSTVQERWFYIKMSALNFWTVRHLTTELKNKSHLQNLNLSSNFNDTMPNMLSNKAIQAFKDQYLLDFVNIENSDDEIDERVLEREIVLNIKKFLMTLGNEFSFMGNQFRLLVNEEENFIDLLFYHRGLQALVAFDLKKGKFKPEYIGKMNYYLSALDDLIKLPHENPSIGIILCKEKDKKKVEYSFRDFSKPLGVATYKTSNKLPPELKNLLPDEETLKNLME